MGGILARAVDQDWRDQDWRDLAKLQQELCLDGGGARVEHLVVRQQLPREDF